MPTDAERLARIDERTIRMGEDLVHLTDEFQSLERMVKALSAEVGSAPDWDIRGSRESLRQRMHNLETTMTPTALAEVLRKVQDEEWAARVVSRAMRNRRTHAWSITQKSFLFGFAILGAVTSALRLIGFGG